MKIFGGYALKICPQRKRQCTPEHETIGGYQITVDFKTACKMMWEKFNEEKRQAVIELPNFDAKVFEDITGINVNKDN